MLREIDEFKKERKKKKDLFLRLYQCYSQYRLFVNNRDARAANSNRPLYRSGAMEELGSTIVGTKYALPLLVEKCDYARCVACNIVTNANYRANRK